MSNQHLIVKEMTQIPAAVAELWGKPPVLPHEDPEAYNKLWLEIAKSVEPSRGTTGAALPGARS
jgi:hypothetical protein